MNRVRSHIKIRQAELAEHPFFRRLSQSTQVEETMAFVAAPTFFVMAFQDILRLNATQIRDPALLDIAKHHRREDSGHDDWFLHDLAELEGSVPDVRWLFGPEHAITRDVSYELVSEVFRVNDDRLRLVLVLVLEAGGHIMFRRMADFLDRDGSGKNLKYFSRSHLNVEMDHGLFEANAEKVLSSIELPQATYRDGIGLVDRGFVALTKLLDGFEQRILDRRATLVR